LIKIGGNGLMPLKDLSSFLYFLLKGNGRGIKWFVVGGELDAWVKYGNGNIEILEEKIQGKIFRHSPENPMSVIEKMLEKGDITHVNSIFEMMEMNKNRSFEDLIKINSPCVYVVLDPTLRFGLGEKFIQLLE
jgi:hypothetical protein